MKRNALFSVVLLAYGMVGCREAHDSSEPSPVRTENGQVIVTPGSPQANSVSLEAASPPPSSILALNGRLVWDENATARLFTSFAGRVIKVSAETGQAVKPGDSLAVIASPDYGQVQADAWRAKTDLAQMEKNLARTKELFSHGAVAEKDLQSAEADMERAGIEKRRAEERLALCGGALEGVNHNYVLKAPIAGVVVEKNISAGAELRSDQMLANVPQIAAPQFVITDPSRLWIQIDVPEREQGKIRVGQTFTLSNLSWPVLSVTGQVEVIGAGLDPATRTVKARGVLINPEGLLKAEMFVKVDFVLEPEPGAEVSTRTVFLRSDKHFVLLETGPGHYMRQEVTIGNEHAGRVIITQGVQPGQRVVADGALLLEQVVDS